MKYYCEVCQSNLKHQIDIFMGYDKYICVISECHYYEIMPFENNRCWKRIILFPSFVILDRSLDNQDITIYYKDIIDINYIASGKYIFNGKSLDIDYSQPDKVKQKLNLIRVFG